MGIEEVRDPASYVRLNSAGRAVFAFPEYRYFQDHATALGEISAESGTYNRPGCNVAWATRKTWWPGSIGSSLSCAGLRPCAWPQLLEEDQQPGSAPVAILSHRVWQARFAGHPAILGETIVLNGQR